MRENIKIYSLNVNQFNGIRNWQGLKIEEIIELWIRNKEYIFAKIKLWLLDNKKNLVFLHEVPNNAKTESKLIHKLFVDECKINGLNLFESDYDLPKKSYFKTVAICNDDNIYKKVKEPDGEPTNRVLVIEDNDSHILYVGVHIPSDDKDNFWDETIDQLNSIYDKYSKEYKIVYIGDINIDYKCYGDEITKPRYDKFSGFLNKCKLVDAWLKKNSYPKIDFIYKVLFNNSMNLANEDFDLLKKELMRFNNNCENEFVSPEVLYYLNSNINMCETFVGHTRIDKVLIGENINPNYYEINYDNSIMHLGYSDHSSICLNIIDSNFFKRI